MGLGRFAEAKDVSEQAQRQNLNATQVHTHMYQLAFVDGNTAGDAAATRLGASKPDEYVAINWQSQTAAFLGQWRRSQDFTRSAIELATRGDAKEVAAQYTAEAALRDAIFSQCSQIKAITSGSERNTLFLTGGAIALALCGDVGQAQSFIDEVSKQRPNDKQPSDCHTANCLVHHEYWYVHPLA